MLHSPRIFHSKQSRSSACGVLLCLCVCVCKSKRENKTKEKTRQNKFEYCRSVFRHSARQGKGNWNRIEPCSAKIIGFVLCIGACSCIAILIVSSSFGNVCVNSILWFLVNFITPSRLRKNLPKFRKIREKHQKHRHVPHRQPVAVAEVLAEVPPPARKWHLKEKPRCCCTR